LSFVHRATLLRFHACCALAAVATLATALTQFSAWSQYLVLCCGLALMGMAQVRTVC